MDTKGELYKLNEPVLSNWKQAFVQTSCTLLIILFLYAATSKLLNYEKFQIQISQSAMLTEYANVIAWSVPALEIIISFLLCFVVTRPAALYASFSMMMAFTIYIFVILHFSSSIPCSCGGILEKMGWTQHLIFNLVFTCISAGAILVATPGQKR